MRSATVAPLKREVRHIGVGGVHRWPNRHRALRPEKVEEIADSMKRLGQAQPIVVRVCEVAPGDPRGMNGYRLVAGLHRLFAAKKLNWPSIQCVVLNDDEGDEVAELIEIDENLIRAELDATERAAHVARRKAIYEAMHPEARPRKGGDRKSATAQNQSAKSAVRSFVDDLAERTGRSKRSIEVDIHRAEALGTDLDRIGGTSLDKGTELDALAAMTPEEREPLIAAAEQGEKVTAIGSAAAPSIAPRQRVRIQQAGEDRADRAAADLRAENIRLRAELAAAQAENNRLRKRTDEFNNHLFEVERWMLDAERIVKARKGAIPRSLFLKVLSLLHPDSRNSTSDEKMSEAFRAFKAHELPLLAETEMPSSERPFMPIDWEARKRWIKEQRREQRATKRAAALGEAPEGAVA